MKRAPTDWSKAKGKCKDGTHRKKRKKEEKNESKRHREKEEKGKWEIK